MWKKMWPPRYPPWGTLVLLRRFLKHFDELDRYVKTSWHDSGCASLLYLSHAEEHCDCWLKETRRLSGHTIPSVLDLDGEEK